MIKLTSKPTRIFLLALMLIGAPLGAFNSSTMFAQGGGDPIEIEGGSYSCPAPAGCGNWGCHSNSQGVQTCSLYKIAGPNECTGSVTCQLEP